MVKLLSDILKNLLYKDVYYAKQRYFTPIVKHENSNLICYSDNIRALIFIDNGGFLDDFSDTYVLNTEKLLMLKTRNYKDMLKILRENKDLYAPLEKIDEEFKEDVNAIKNIYNKNLIKIISDDLTKENYIHFHNINVFNNSFDYVLTKILFNVYQHEPVNFKFIHDFIKESKIYKFGYTDLSFSMFVPRKDNIIPVIFRIDDESNFNIIYACAKMRVILT